MGEEEAQPEIKDRTVNINRVSKVVKGGKRFGFSAIVIVGDERGRVGAGMGKAREVPESIRKGIEDAKKQMITVPLRDSTIPYRVEGVFGASRVVMRPASEGTGVIAGKVVRAVMELAGIKDVLTKAIGSKNPHSLVRATMDALKSLRRTEDVARVRDKKIEEMI